jgi:biotin carboxyl carrier protein
MSEKPEYKVLTIDGTNYKTTYTKKYESRKNWQHSKEKEIISRIPGTIVKLNVVEGQKVKLGQNLIVLQAMKMHNNILSPFDGEIKKIFIEEGQKAPKGTKFIEFK